MKQKSRFSKIYAILGILALLFLFAVNSTYAYFSAQKTINKSGKMDTMVVNWYGSVHRNLVDNTDNTYSINPATTSVARGDIITFADNEIVGFYCSGTPAYVRFWLEAKIADSTEDYSNYFELQFYVDDEYEIDETQNVTMVTGKDNTETGENENLTVYYYDEAIGSSSGANTVFISGVKLDENAPMELLGQNGLTLTLHFDAVQAGNSAFESYFDDWKGYSPYWE